MYGREIRIKSRLIVGGIHGYDVGEFVFWFQSELNLGLLWGLVTPSTTPAVTRFQSELNLGLLWGAITCSSS